MANRNSKNWNSGSIFKKFSASLTVLLLLASTNLTTAALANDQGGRGPAFRAFEMANPGLDRQELRQAFKQVWNAPNINDANNSSFALPSSHIQSLDLSSTSAMQSMTQPVIIDLSQVGTTIQNGVQSTVEPNGNVTIIAPPDVTNIQTINAPPGGDTVNLPATTGATTPSGNIIVTGGNTSVSIPPATSGGSITLSTPATTGVDPSTFTQVGSQTGAVTTGANATGSGAPAATITGANVTINGSTTGVNGVTSITAPSNVITSNQNNGLVATGNGISKGNKNHEPKVHEPKVQTPKINNQTIQQTSKGTYINVKGGLALDLGSAVETITLGDKLFGAQESVTVNVGGQEKTFSAGSKVTAAEYVAAKQALAGGQQTVTLDASGRATGGVVDLSSMTTGDSKLKVTNLTVPVSVTASGDFGKGGDVKMAGDIYNSGSISAFASENNQVNALIKAANITNNVGGSIISSVSDLTLQADKNFSNFGDISASGNLTISAGKILTNSGEISAAGNLNVLSPKVTNTGTLASTNANVNLDTPVVAAMNVLNHGGTISAANGAINVRSANYTGKFNTTITGGDLLSKELNAYTGGGTTDVFVNELTGIVNISGTAAHVSANTSDLIIGNQCLIGDPTYYNSGNIIIGGNILVGEALAIIAGGNITTDQLDLDITAQNLAGQGFDINIIAGANVPNGSGQVTPGGGPATLPGQSIGSVSQNNPGSLTFSGASVTGGNIDFSSASTLDITSSSTSGNLNAGNITLVAFADPTGNTGKVLLPAGIATSINANGSGSGTNGNVTVIAGSNVGIAMQIGFIQNNGGSGSSATTGNVSLIVADPTLTLPSITFGTNGSITNGAQIVASNTLKGGEILASSMAVSGDITLRTDGNLTAGNLSAGQGAPNGRSITLVGRDVVTAKLSAQHNGPAGDGGTISITSNSATNFNLGAPGTNGTGLVSVAAGSVGNGGTINVTNLGTGGITLNTIPGLDVTDGNGGNLILDAGTGDIVFNINFPINVSGVGTDRNGGSIQLNGAHITSAFNFNLNADATGAGAGGNILLQANASDADMAVGAGVNQFSLSAVGGTIDMRAGRQLILSASGNFNADQFNLESGLSGINSQRFISGDDIKMTSTGTVSITGAGNDIAATGTLEIVAPSVLMNSVVLSANEIFIYSQAGSALTLDGTLGGATLDSNVATHVTASSGALTLNGLTTYIGTAILSGESIVASGASTNTATAESFLITSNLTGSVGAQFINAPGPWVITNSGTFANNPGSITIDGSLIFSGGNTANGGNLAIISTGDITINGSIDLTGLSGGQLLMLAGYTFEPDTGGIPKFDTTTTYDTFTPGGAGSVTVTGNIDTSASGSSGVGGSVHVLANNGSISLQNITTTALNGGGGFAGDVVLYATGDISANNIDTRGTTTSGSVDLAVASPTLSIAFQVQNGVSTGSILRGVLADGAINVNNINSSFRQTTIATGGNGNVNVSGTLTSSNIQVSTGLLTFTGTQTLSASALETGAGGTMLLAVSRAVTTVGGGTLLLQAVGTGNNNGGLITFVSSSSASTTISSTGHYAFDVGSQGSGSGGIIDASFGGDLTLSTGGVVAAGTGGAVAQFRSAGDITVNSGAFSLNNSLGDGSRILLSAVDTLTLNDTTFFAQADGSDTNSNGGGLIFAGQNIVAPGLGNTAANPFRMTARGTGTGSGGTIDFETQSAIPIFVGQPAKAPKGPAFFFEADASGGGNGGSIRLYTGGSLTINNTALVNANRGSVGNLNGAKYDFCSGVNSDVSNPVLIINGSLEADGLGVGNGGLIRLTSRNSKAFTIGVANPKNGVNGELDAFGNSGLVEIINNAGGITFGALGNVTASDVHYIMNGSKGSFTAAAGTIVRAFGDLTFSAQGGSIGGKKLITVDAPVIEVNTSGKGTVGLNNTYSAGDMTLRDSSSGGSFTLITAQGATVNDIITAAKGTILVVANTGNLVVANDSRITATSGALTLQNTNTSGQIQIGDNAVVETQLKGKNTTLVVGATIPKTGTNPTTIDVGNLDVAVQGKGVVFLGGTPGNEAVSVPVSANANAINKNVIFSGPAGSIVLGTGSTITADPPAPTPSVATAAALPAQSSPNMNGLFGFLTEKATITSDLSVPNLSTVLVRDSALHAPSNMLAGSTSGLAGSNSEFAGSTSARAGSASGLTSSSDEDNSYAVGYCPATGCVDGAMCSDSEIVAGQIAGGARVQTIQHSDRVVIKKGNVLFVPFKDTVVETPNGIVHIDAKAIAFVSTSEAGLAVYDLEDQHKGSVSVESNGHNVVLSPGRHVMISKHHGAEFAQINAVETIAHRNVQSTVKNGHRAHTSEFSLISALDTVKPLRVLAMSKHAHAKQIAERMMKTTAIILQIGGASGQYQHYFKPRMTAKL